MAMNLNDAPSQLVANIPAGTIAPVRLIIKPGGHTDIAQGWDGGFATQNPNKGSVYISCEFTVLAGDYAKERVYSLIGLYSPNGESWSNSGRGFMRGIINSAYGLGDKDNSPDTQKIRNIQSLGELDGIEFIARIGVNRDANGEERNEIRSAITIESENYKEYAKYLQNQARSNSSNPSMADEKAPWEVDDLSDPIPM